MFTNNRKLGKGFTLLELLIAIAVLLILIVPLTMMVFSSIRFYQRSQEHKRAAELLNKAYERAVAADFDISGEEESDDGFTIEYEPAVLIESTYEVLNGKCDFTMTIEFGKEHHKVEIKRDEGLLETFSVDDKQNITITVEEEGNKTDYKIKAGDREKSFNIDESAFGLLVESKSNIPEDFTVILDYFPRDVSKTFTIYALDDISEHIISNSPYVVISSPTFDDKKREDEQKSLQIIVKNKRGEVLRDEIFFYKKSKLNEEQ